MQSDPMHILAVPKCASNASVGPRVVLEFWDHTRLCASPYAGQSQVVLVLLSTVRETHLGPVALAPPRSGKGGAWPASLGASCGFWRGGGAGA